ncbi:hypothetical protein PsorP6_012810 [Peronosclerospora sorghi]|uniref:Uncharacterized protein n=1 Tax=Peronosclerospora sorghi TaxID=230839 RepID=A0ACC0WHG8_9STRA|nr:hypothetical protein PsorP6_012810 [Peronosclerospora sorghi]
MDQHESKQIERGENVRGGLRFKQMSQGTDLGRPCLGARARAARALVAGTRRARGIATNPGTLVPDDQVVVISQAADLLNGSYTIQELGDDTILRCLVAIGTLALFGDSKAKEAASSQIGIFTASKASQVTSPVVQECLAELKLVLN